MKCFRKLLGTSYRDHITNDKVRDRIRQAIAHYDDILTTVTGNASLSGLGMYQECKEGEEGADKRSVGRIISLSGRVEVLQRPKRS